MKRIFILFLLVTFSCQERNKSIVLREVQVPIEFLSIKTPFLFKIDDKHAFKLGCEPTNKNGFWRQAYYHGDEDTTICISVINKEINYKNFLNSSKVYEYFVSCLEYSGGITSSGTHLFSRDYMITSDNLRVTTVSKYDSSSLGTNKTYYRKSISIKSASHNISVVFSIRFDDKIPLESAVNHFEDYEVLYYQ